MKVYIAAPWLHKQDAIKVGAQFIQAGFEVTSRWFHHEGDPNDTTGANVPIETIQTQALEDIEDVKRAECLIVLNLCKSEGKAVETGIALASHIPIISIGKRSNIFQTLGLELDSIEEALEYLKR